MPVEICMHPTPSLLVLVLRTLDALHPDSCSETPAGCTSLLEDLGPYGLLMTIEQWKVLIILVFELHCRGSWSESCINMWQILDPMNSLLWCNFFACEFVQVRNLYEQHHVCHGNALYNHTEVSCFLRSFP